MSLPRVMRDSLTTCPSSGLILQIWMASVPPARKTVSTRGGKDKHVGLNGRPEDFFPTNQVRQEERKKKKKKRKGK